MFRGLLALSCTPAYVGGSSEQPYASGSEKVIPVLICFD